MKPILLALLAIVSVSSTVQAKEIYGSELINFLENKHFACSASSFNYALSYGTFDEDNKRLPALHARVVNTGEYKEDEGWYLLDRRGRRLTSVANNGRETTFRFFKVDSRHFKIKRTRGGSYGVCAHVPEIPTSFDGDFRDY